MTEAEVRAALTDRLALALTMWGEARGDWREGDSSVEERIAVGCVVRNRLAAWKAYRAAEPTWRAVCLAPAQFSCWQAAGGAANYAAVMAQAARLAMGLPTVDALLRESLFLADGIMAGVIIDRTDGATSYYAPAAMVPAGRVPAWAQGKDAQPIGAQLFLRV